MTVILPEISRQIRSRDIFAILEKRYSEIGTVWMPMQLEWLNSVYLTFKTNLFQKNFISMFK